MPPDTYSPKEMIQEMKQDLKDFREENNKRFDAVDAAQAHTNGDVTWLKLKQAEMKGGIRVFCIIFSIIVLPLLVYVWNQAQKQRSKLEALSNYQQQYEITTNNKNH